MIVRHLWCNSSIDLKSFLELFFHFSACDACNIWYHGNCIGISEKESSRIENFFCHQCRRKKIHPKWIEDWFSSLDKNPALQIKYNRPQKEIEDRLSKYIVVRPIRLIDGFVFIWMFSSDDYGKKHSCWIPIITKEDIRVQWIHVPMKILWVINRIRRLHRQI